MQGLKEYLSTNQILTFSYSVNFDAGSPVFLTILQEYHAIREIHTVKELFVYIRCFVQGTDSSSKGYEF